MTDLVPTEDIERLVGASRHPALHLGRADTRDSTIYILHSQVCKDSGVDLRFCPYSLTLDAGIRDLDWAGWENRPVVLSIATGWLVPSSYSGDQ